MEHIGKWWTRIDDERVRCELCPRYCEMRPGQRGFCFVRKGTPTGVALTTYGRSSGFCIDPIEKKPLNHFYPGSSILSFGTAGCNLGCQFCQNWQISKVKDFDRLQTTATPNAIANSAKERKCKSVAFTYNDPVIFAEYAIDTANECHAIAIKTVAVTAGYITDKAREEFFGAMDAANIDLKAFTNDFYRKFSLAKLQPVLETLEYVAKETKVWLEITTLLIPGANDSPEEIEKMTQWIYTHLGPSVPLHFTAFHPDFRLQEWEATPLSSLRRARDIAIKNGLLYVYTGNVRDIEGGTTYCPKCKKQVLERNGYFILSNKIEDGCCGYCGEVIAGHF